jgi:hypothetical protein
MIEPPVSHHEDEGEGEWGEFTKDERSTSIAVERK